MYLETAGEDAAWSLDAQLLALIADILQAANYQRGGGKGKRPTPIPRPGVSSKEKVPDTAHYGSDPIRTDEFAGWWAEGFQDELIGGDRGH